MLQWYKSDECKYLVVMLSGSHIQMNFSKVTGQDMEDYGWKDIVAETEAYGEKYNREHNERVTTEPRHLCSQAPT